MPDKELSPEEAKRALRLLENPQSFFPLYYAALSIQSAEQAADWLGSSAGNEPELFVKSQLLAAIQDASCTDLQGFVLFQLRRFLPHAEAVH